MLSQVDSERVIRAYRHRESDRLDGVSETTAARLRAERAEQDAARRAYEEAERKRSKDNEDLCRARYMAAGNSEQDWKRDRERVLADAAQDRIDRHRRHGGALISRSEALA